MRRELFRKIVGAAASFGLVKASALVNGGLPGLCHAMGSRELDYIERQVNRFLHNLGIGAS